MNKSNFDKNEATQKLALLRYGIIAPLLTNTYTNNSKMAFFREASQKKYILPSGKETMFTYGTIKRWYLLYQKNGYNALVPKKRSDLGGSRTLTDECKEKILELKQKFPHITGKAIYTKLIQENIVNSKDISLASLYRFLNAHSLNYTATVERKAFEMEFANDCWQCDTSHGPVLNINGSKTQTYLIQIIDDASRVIVGNEFFLNDNSLNLQKVLKQAIKTYGVPKKVFVDNGKPYKNLQFQTICASIGTILIHSSPYSPESKGKIERSFRTVKDNFINCIDWNSFKDLEDLNSKYDDYVSTNYNNSLHSGIETTPRLRFQQDFDRLRFIQNDDILNEMFLHTYERKVATDATINLFSNLYEVPQKYIKQYVTIRISPYDLDVAYIYDANGVKTDTIKPVEKVDNSKIKRNSISYSN